MSTDANNKIVGANGGSVGALRGVVSRTDALLMLGCCILVGGRGQIDENFGVGWRLTGPVMGPEIGTGEVSAMMIFSGLILGAWAVWVMVRLAYGGVVWRKTGLGIGFLLMIAGAVWSTAVASNKSAAAAGSVVFLSLVLLGMLLAQLLDTSFKRRVMLCVLAATGVALAYRCFEQRVTELPAAEQMFTENPRGVLASQGIEPDSYAAKKYAARVASRDVGGFFSISNTAGSLLGLSGMSVLCLLAGLWRGRGKNVGGVALLILFWVGITGGLAITQSKGAIVAYLVSLAGAGIVLWRRAWLGRHWRGALAVAGLLIVGIIAGVWYYGASHDGLPTGSLLVRWQYWQSSGKLIAEHGLAGVGMRNYDLYYPRYMSASAPEVINDPHCLPISLWCQWGVLGFVGLLFAVGGAAVRLSRGGASELSAAGTAGMVEEKPGSFGGAWWALGIGAGIFVCRWAVSEFGGYPSLKAMMSVVVILYVLPGLVWLTAFYGFYKATEVGWEDRSRGVWAVLGCGLAGFLIHNLIDFSIFQPGVMGCFAAGLGAAAAGTGTGQKTDFASVRPGLMGSLAMGFAVIGIILMLWLWVMLPISRGYRSLKQAERLYLSAENLPDVYARGMLGGMNERDRTEVYAAAKHLAERSRRENPRNGDGPYVLGMMGFLQWLKSSPQSEQAFEESIAYLNEAKRLNPENYLYDHQISRMYQYALLSQPGRKEYIARATESLELALTKRPYEVQDLLVYGGLLESQGRGDEAGVVYAKALQLEEDFLAFQYRIFGDWGKVIGRLSESQKRQARERIEAIKKNISLPRMNTK